MKPVRDIHYIIAIHKNNWGHLSTCLPSIGGYHSLKEDPIVLLYDQITAKYNKNLKNIYRNLSFF